LFSSVFSGRLFITRETLREGNRTLKALKKFAAVGMAVAAVVTMSACGAQLEEDGSNSSVKVFAVTFPDNSKVDCLLLDAVETAGLECAYGKKSVATETKHNLLGSFELIGGEKVRCVSFDGVKEGALDCEMEKTAF
jgi:hypothetical protein